MSQKQRPVRAGGDWSPFGRAGVGVPYDSLEMQASQRTRRRLRLAVALFSVVFTVLVGRLFNLTILHVPTANASAQNSAQSAAERPDILDRNGRVLATQIMATTLGIDLDKIRDRDGLIEDLSKILNPDHLPQLERARERKGFLEVANNLSPEQKRAVLALGNPHLKLEDAPIRVYPSGPVAAHITGFVGRDQTGFSGLEYYLDRNELLTEDLQTSIDINVQHVTRHGLASAIKRYSAKSGTAIITDVNSGEIISLVSLLTLIRTARCATAVAIILIKPCRDYMNWVQFLRSSLSLWRLIASQSLKKMCSIPESRCELVSIKLMIPMGRGVC